MMPRCFGERRAAEDRRLIAAPEPPFEGVTAPGDNIGHIAVTIFNGKRERERAATVISETAIRLRCDPRYAYN